MAAPQVESESCRHRPLSWSTTSRISSPGSSNSIPPTISALFGEDPGHEGKNDELVGGSSERIARKEKRKKKNSKERRGSPSLLVKKKTPKLNPDIAPTASIHGDDDTQDEVNNKSHKFSPGSQQHIRENFPLKIGSPSSKPRRQSLSPEEERNQLMYWITSESQTSPPPPPPTFVEERIPIIARRRSSGEVEVLGWCSRARPTTTTRSSSRPLNSSPLSAHSHTTHDNESESTTQRVLSLPWTNHRLLPNYPAAVSPTWSTSSESSSCSSSINGDNYGTFSHNTFSNNHNDDEDESDNSSTEPSETDTTPLLTPKGTDPPVTWLSLPHKSQLFILALCRLSEPLTQTSVSSYLYYYLASFHSPDLPPPSAATISRQAGLLASSFALSQCVTGVFWGRLSDRIGRKPCILIGLAGTTISAIGFGFSESITAALFWRILGGALNGNVGVLRTMVTEIMVEKKYQSRAFLILPMCSNIGIIIGPILGGLLADPAGTWPDVWGNVGWAVRWKWALPNVVSAVFLATSWFAGFLFLRETLEKQKPGLDIGIHIRKKVWRWLKQVYGSLRGKQPLARSSDDLKGNYTAIRQSPLNNIHDEETALPSSPISFTKPIHTAPTPFRKIFTPNIITTLISFAIIPLHNSTFLNLWSIFLSTPRSLVPSSSSFGFTGGLGLPAHQVGLAMSYLGVIGILSQLFCYPSIQARLGLLRSFRWACCLFPVAYILTPFLSRLPSVTPSPEPADGFLVWAGIATVLLLQVTARTFALPGSVILLTNSVEERGVLGSVHGVAISLSAASRAVGPALGGALYALGLEGGIVGGVFWVMACTAAVGAGSTVFLKEGKGISQEVHESEEEVMEEAGAREGAKVIIASTDKRI